LNILHLCISAAAFGALTLMAGWLEGHLPVKKLSGGGAGASS